MVSLPGILSVGVAVFLHGMVMLLAFISDFGEGLTMAGLAAHIATRDAELLMPVEGVTLSQVADTWGAARSEGRSHEGVDIFATAGTPIYSATAGYVEYYGPYGVGGNTVTVVGAGGVRYYYAHLSGYAEGLEQGQPVTPETLLGYVGNTGNAATTPPHLHFGVYTGYWEAENPYPLLADRAW